MEEAEIMGTVVENDTRKKEDTADQIFHPEEYSQKVKEKDN